ncbi:hypothetical protein SNOG_02238 [Parastagonospora nodorum SN15]|uniref:Uncharacterized protein n=1 Tax=Phaeosphaeria nodorum (strain SN15 / ATCC MYA-4574 / FGSC 10173) TaxID=321614 RepID=Q0V176_PHANO|nr:hypothetical protein SNOG_02238 [Parastagonospora nodorum SN15]EAT90450.1 hypothetical protein SNOG_02238 [Parastagonospora nodorum SN15]
MTAGILSIPLIMTVYVATMWDVAFVHSTSQLKKMPRVHAYASARPGAVQYARSPHVARRGLNVNAQIWDFVNNKIFKSLAMVGGTTGIGSSVSRVPAINVSVITLAAQKPALQISVISVLPPKDCFLAIMLLCREGVA